MGLLTIRSDQESADENQHGAIGMIVVSDQAISVGVTAVPHPIADGADDGWFMFQPFSQRFSFLDATGVQSHMVTQYMIDSKAKRVVHDGQSIALVIENVSTIGLTFGFVLRTLSQVRGT